MKKHKKLLCLVLVVVFAISSLTVTGCSKDSASDEKVLKIAVDLPLTGPCAKQGREFKDATELAFEEVGYKIGDYKIELVWVDDESDPEKGRRAYEQAIQREKVDVGLSNWNSSVAVALMDVAAKYQIPHFFPIGAAGTINEKWHSDEKYKYYISKGWAEPSKMTVAYVEAINTAIEKGIWKPKNKKLAIYGDDNDWGRTFGGSIAERFKAQGWEVVAEEYTKMGETDFYPLLTKFKKLEPSLVAGTISSGQSMASFIKQTRELNLKSILICDALSETANFYELTGDASDYVLDNRPVFATEEGKKFAAKFKEKFGYEPSAAAAGQQYDYTRFFIQVANETLKEYGELNKDTLFKYSQEKLVTGEIAFTDSVLYEKIQYDSESMPDPIVGEGYYIHSVIQFFGGEPTVIWPESSKEKDLQIPDYMK